MELLGPASKIQDACIKNQIPVLRNQLLLDTSEPAKSVSLFILPTLRNSYSKHWSLAVIIPGIELFVSTILIK